MLETEGLCVYYGGVRALHRCSLRVQAGMVHGIIGPNGSGKTTWMDAVSGYVRPREGEVRLEGKPIGGLPPYRRARLGLSRTFQIPRPLGDLTVRENIALPDGLISAGSGAAFSPEDALRMVGLESLSDIPARYLSFGQKRLLDLMRAMAPGPRILLLDEPTAGVNPNVINQLATAIEAGRDAGITVVLIEHNMDFVRRLCDVVTVLAEGEVLIEGPVQEVLANEEVLDVYFGQPREEVPESP